MKNLFKKDYKLSMPLSGVAVSWFERDKKKFAYLDYDVKKGFKWEMKFYEDEEKKKAFLEASQQKLSFLAGQSGYEFKSLADGRVLGTWVPKKRFLNILLRSSYTLVVDGNVVASAPGDSFLKLFIPGAIRKMMSRKVLSADGKVIAKISVQSALGCGVVKVSPANGEIADEGMATAVAVFAAICGLQD